MNGDNTGLKGKRINHKSNASLKGFTLVELIVVLVILAILAAVAVPVMLGYTDNAKNKEYISDAESAYNAAQAALTDLYNNASNELNHAKRMKIAELAGVDANNTTFKVWTSSRLVDGETPSTSKYVGSYTLVNAVYETKSDGTGLKLFYDGKNWNVFDNDDDLKTAMSNAGVDDNSKNIIHMWPDYSMGGPSDYAYDPKTLQEEQWEAIDVNNNTYTLKIHNFNSVQGKSEPGIKFYKDEIETNEDTLTVEFEKDDAGGIKAINWISDFEIKNDNVTYLIKYIDGFKNLKWCTKKNPKDATSEDLYTYDTLKNNIIRLNGDGITDVYAVTEKEVISRTINFMCVGGSSAFTFRNGETLLPITFKKYVNRYDCDDYNKNKLLNTGDGTITEVKNIIVNKGYEVNKWAFHDASGYELSGENLKPYDANTEEAELWTKVFAIEYGTDSEEGLNLSGYEFVGMSKKVKNVTLYADSKNCSSFKGAKSLKFKEEYDEILKVKSDDFDDYNDKPLEPIAGFRHTGWEEYNVHPADTYASIEKIWEVVRAGSESEYAFIAKVTYGSKAKFLCVSKEDDTSTNTLYGQLSSLFGGNRNNSDVNLIFHKKSYSEAVSFLKSASVNNDIIGGLMTGYDDSDVTNDAAISCSNHCVINSINRSVEEGTITRTAVLWDGNDTMYSIPIFAYNIVSSDNKTYHVYWFSREEHPELVGNFSTVFKNFYNINLADSHMADWNTASCTNMKNMFLNSGIGDNQVDFTKWDYSSVTDMTGMFQNCDNIKNFSFANCEMPVCIKFNNIFRNCDKLATVNFDRLKTPSLEYVSDMFVTDSGSVDALVSFSAKGWYAPSLTSLKAILKNKKLLEYASFSDYDETNKTDLSSCQWFSEVFYGCAKIREISLEGVNLPVCKSIQSMCRACTKLSKVNFDNSKMPNVTDISNLFTDTNNLTIISARGWILSSVGGLSQFLQNKKALTTVDFGKYTKDDNEITTDFSKCNTVYRMLYGCSSLVNVSFEGVDLSSCTNVGEMMRLCTKLEKVVFNYCDMSTYSGAFSDTFFGGDTNLKYFYAKGWNVNKATSLKNLFNRGTNTGTLPDGSSGTYGISSIKEVDFSEADLSSLNSLENTFRDCPSLITVSFEGAKVGKTDEPVKVNADFCFFHCFYLEEVNFNFAEGRTLYPEKMYKFFDYCQSLNNVTFTDGDDWRSQVNKKFNTKYATDMRNVFYQCYSLNNIVPFYEEFSFESATSTLRMFLGANLEGMEIKFANKKMPNLKQTKEMFMATSVKKISFIDCEFGALTDYHNMFNCNAKENEFIKVDWIAKSPVQEIDFTGSTMSKLTSTSKLFRNCMSLEKITLDNCKMPNVTSVPKDTFEDDNNLKYFYARGLQAPKLTSFNYTFNERTGLEVFDISDFNELNSEEVIYTNISACTSFDSMFSGCTSLQTVVFPDNIDMSKVTTFHNMFTDCSVYKRTSFKELISHWNLKNSTISFTNPSGDGAGNIFVGRNTVDFAETIECYSADGQHFKIGGSPLSNKTNKALIKID